MLVPSVLKNYSKNIEIVKFKEKDSKIRGVVKVSLFDKDNGEKILEAKTENIITTIGYEYFRWAIQDGIIRTSSFTKPTFNNPFNLITLYSSNEPEQDEPFPNLYGLVGYSELTTYSGSDTLRGTINLAESKINYDKYLRSHFVFDWPTHAANGTFQTIAWVYNATPIRLRAVRYFSISVAYPDGLEWDGSNFWVGVSSQINKIDPSTGAVILSLTFPDKNPRGFAWDGTNLWVSGYYTGKLYKINPTTGEVILSFASPDPYPYDMAWDGTNLWLVGYNTEKLYKINPATGAVIESLAFPVKYVRGLTWDGEYLWLANNSGIYKFDLTTNKILLSCSSPTSYVYGLAWDGTKLWALDYYYHELYAYDYVLYGARTLLPSPITKTSQQTMKIEYDFVFQV